MLDQWPDEATELTPENFQALLQHTRRIEAIIDGLTQMRVKKFTYEPGKYDMELQNEFLPMLANILVDIFKASGGANYVAWSVSSEELGPLEMTLQRRWGKTPSQLVAELKAENQALREARDSNAQQS